jgi:hypothetical protein
VKIRPSVFLNSLKLASEMFLPFPIFSRLTRLGFSAPSVAAAWASMSCFTSSAPSLM